MQDEAKESKRGFAWARLPRKVRAAGQVLLQELSTNSLEDRLFNVLELGR